MADDKIIKQAVLDELAWDPSVEQEHIGVTSREGVVTLSGHVGTYAEKYAAEKATQRVKGVKGVAEELEVRFPSSSKYGDEDIAATVVSRLKWNAFVPANAVKVKVEKGWVSLTGEVGWHYQFEAAASDVRGLLGVVGVSNNIKIKPEPNAVNIRANIVTALHRSWFDPANIKVETADGRVTLSGDVENWLEREEAATSAWASPGVTSVVNDIRVN